MIISVDNIRTNKLKIIKGEKKYFEFIVYDKNDQTIDLSTATLEFQVKTAPGQTADLTVLNGSMDKADAASGKVLIPVDTTTLTAGVEYYTELRIIFGLNSVDHSGSLMLSVDQPIVE